MVGFDYSNEAETKPMAFSEVYVYSEEPELLSYWFMHAYWHAVDTSCKDCFENPIAGDRSVRLVACTKQVCFKGYNYECEPEAPYRCAFKYSDGVVNTITENDAKHFLYERTWYYENLFSQGIVPSETVMNFVFDVLSRTTILSDQFQCDEDFAVILMRTINDAGVDLNDDEKNDAFEYLFMFHCYKNALLRQADENGYIAINFHEGKAIAVHIKTETLISAYPNINPYDDSIVFVAKSMPFELQDFYHAYNGEGYKYFEDLDPINRVFLRRAVPVFVISAYELGTRVLFKYTKYNEKHAFKVTKITELKDGHPDTTMLLFDYF